MSRILTITLAIFASLQMLQAQWVKEDDTSKFWMNEGVYMTEMELLENSPQYSWIDFDRSDWRFVDSLNRKGIAVTVKTSGLINDELHVNYRHFLVEDSSGYVLVERKEVWGICSDGDPYRHVDRARNNNFRRIHVQGTISFLTYQVVYEDPFYWNPDVMNTDPNYRNESVDLVVDFEEKRIYANKRSVLEEILQRDEELYQEYLQERKKGRSIYDYIKRYNKRHPIEFTTVDPESSKPDKQ